MKLPIYPQYNGVPIVVDKKTSDIAAGKPQNLQDVNDAINDIAKKTGDYPPQLMVSPKQYDMIKDLLSMPDNRIKNLDGKLEEFKIGDWVLRPSGPNGNDPYALIGEILEPDGDLLNARKVAVRIIDGPEKGRKAYLAKNECIKVPKGDPDYLRTLYDGCSTQNR